MCECKYTGFLDFECDRKTAEIGDLSSTELDVFLEASGYEWYIETLPEIPPEGTPLLLIREVKKRTTSEAFKIKQEIERGGDCYHLENLRNIADSIRELRNDPWVEMAKPEPAITQQPEVIPSEPITIEPFHYSAAVDPPLKDSQTANRGTKKKAKKPKKLSANTAITELLIRRKGDGCEGWTSSQWASELEKQCGITWSEQTIRNTEVWKTYLRREEKPDKYKQESH